MSSAAGSVYILVVPSLGDSITEGSVVALQKGRFSPHHVQLLAVYISSIGIAFCARNSLAGAGDSVQVDDVMVVIETDKVHDDWLSHGMGAQVV